MVVLFVLLVALEVVLVGKVDPQETPVGAGVGIVAGIATVVALHRAKLAYRVRPSWCWLVLPLVRNVVRDTFVVFGVLLRRLAGARVEDAYADVPFDPGGADPESAARRALVIAGVSTAPNDIVLDVDAERGTLRVHQLAASGSGRLSRAWPL